MGRKRKLFTGTKPIGGPTLKSRRVARVVTSKYHSIRNEQAQISQSNDLSEAEKQDKLQELDKKLVEIGGTNRYQQASIISTQHFKTSRWVLQTLEQLGMKKSNEEKLNALEVGAINIQLKQCSWMNIRCIDVNSQHPQIEELDFFDLPPKAEYDVVVCSMVVNCVTVPIKRGEMLARCIDSKHIGGSSKFESLLKGLGLVPLLPQRITPRLIFYTLGRSLNPSNVNISKTNWEQCMRRTIRSSMGAEALEQFCKDYSQVSPNEFSVSIPQSLLSSS